MSSTAKNYDAISVVIHWLIALLVFALFFSGLWMVKLDYYSPWFQLAPWWHKGLGTLTFSLVSLRFVLRFFRAKPTALSSYNPWQVVLSKIVHSMMNWLVVLLMLSGYFIVTAQGQPLILFDVIKIPALLDSVVNLEDKAGWLHYYLANGLIALALGHMVMALKHHYIDHDATLARMLGKKPSA